MATENPYRIALLLVMLLTMSITVYFRRKAASGETISYRDEGCLFAVILRLAGVCLWIRTFVYLLNPISIHWASMPFPAWVRWSGVISGGFCSWMMYWTLSSLGRNLTDTVMTRINAVLVTQGPYRWVRHPFYVTAALLMASATLISANWAIGASSVLVLALLAIRTPNEEQKLVERFGEDYRQYMRTTGRFFPKVLR
jgi:protein-S-isoprenylcysteine O-methyltransferase Ste14